MLRNQLHDSLSVMDHELLIRVLRNLDGDQHQEDYFDLTVTTWN